MNKKEIQIPENSVHNHPLNENFGASKKIVPTGSCLNTKGGGKDENNKNSNETTRKTRKEKERD